MVKELCKGKLGCPIEGTMRVGKVAICSHNDYSEFTFPMKTFVKWRRIANASHNDCVVYLK